MAVAKLYTTPVRPLHRANGGNREQNPTAESPLTKTLLMMRRRFRRHRRMPFPAGHLQVGHEISTPVSRVWSFTKKAFGGKVRSEYCDTSRCHFITHWGRILPPVSVALCDLLGRLPVGVGALFVVCVCSIYRPPLLFCPIMRILALNLSIDERRLMWNHAQKQKYQSFIFDKLLFLRS